MSEINTNDLNEQVEVTVHDAEVVTVPIDATLSNSGEAADAKAVGDALAQKADADAVVAIKVNGQAADNQGLILIDGSEIPVSGTNTKKISEVLENITAKTAENIPMSSDAGAKMIAEVVNENTEAIENMQDKTGANIPMDTGSSTTIKAAIESLDQRTVKTINKKGPDADGDVDMSVVPLAENLQSDKMQSIEGSFIQRTTGGNGSVSDGKAYPQHIYGHMERTGYVAESLNMTVIPITRTEPDKPITATIDRDTFVAYVDESGTIDMYYTTEWSADPALYGVTVTGTPVAGDQIRIVYVKEERGTIRVAAPGRLIATGWNLFNINNGYAKVVRYSSEYGYKVGGGYSSLTFSATLTGERTSITPSANGLFNVPSNGYVFVNGGNGTDTYILATWSDWQDGPSTGYWEPYKESGITINSVIETYLPNGVLAIGTVKDEIDFSAKRAISRIDRMTYSAENLAAAVATGRDYIYDTNYIYIVRAEAVINAITIDGEYTVSEHGLEYFTETVMPLETEILYGKNLRDKLERDVLTISAQTLTTEEQKQVRQNIGVMDPPTNGYGTAAQLLKTNGDGTTEWTTQGTPTDAQVGTAVSAWLTAHPEATTTVQDGAISRAKLDSDLKSKTDDVPVIKSKLSNLGSISILPMTTGTAWAGNVKFVKSADGTITVTGTNSGSGNRYLDFFDNQNEFPTGIKAGDCITLAFDSDTENIKMDFRCYISGNLKVLCTLYGGNSKTVIIPENATGCRIFLLVKEGVTYSGNVLKPFMCFSRINMNQECVTPEMFGAYGNGTIDDTEAWQKAVDSGKNVVALSKKYLCGKIEVTKNISIDCNGAEFTCSENTLFDIHGSVEETLTGQTEYSANKAYYRIRETGYTEYTGMAMLQGTNNFEQSRSNYKGGFVCAFYKGLMDESYPIDVTNEGNGIDILLITPITVKLKNIGNISHTVVNKANVQSIKINYGFNCTIENINTNVSPGFVLIDLVKCLRCKVKEIRHTGQYGSSGTNSYVISIKSSSYCTVRDSYIHNRYWHTITTGGDYLCYKNLIDNCMLLNEMGYAYDDHENGVGTSIINSTVQGLVVSAQAYINNVIILSSKSDNRICVIMPSAPTDNRLAGFTIENVTFVPDANCSGGCGILLESYPTESGKTLFYDKMIIENIKVESETIEGKIWSPYWTSQGSNKTIVLGKLRINNCELEIDGTITNENVITTNFDAKKAVYENAIA